MKKTLLIGEVGLAHEGSLGLAFSMIKECKRVNLDYVKFQLHNPEFESTKNEDFRVRVFPQDTSRYDYWNRTTFTIEEWRKIVEYCKEVGIGFLCTPFSVWAAEVLLGLGVREVKVASGDCNNWELLTYLKSNFETIIVSTGMSFNSEVIELCKFMADYNGTFIVLQCTSSYPVTPKNVGLNYLLELFSVVNSVGLSDHTGNPLVSIAAISCNSSIIEFHVVFSKKQFGPDSSSSMTFEEANLISQYRDLWVDLFDSDYSKDKIATDLLDMRKTFGRGLSLKNPLAKGETVYPEMFVMKKPLGPLNWGDRERIVGKIANRDISADEHITNSDFN